MAKKRLTNDEQNQALYARAVQEARNYYVNLLYFERWFIELNPPNGMSVKYKALLLFALVGFHKAKVLAQMFNYSSEKALNEDFNKKIGSLVRLDSSFTDEKERLGITSIRSACFYHKQELFLVRDDNGLVNMLSQRYTENIHLEESSMSSRSSVDELSKN